MKLLINKSKSGGRPTIDGMTYGDLFGDDSDDEEGGPVPSAKTETKQAAWKALHPNV